MIALPRLDLGGEDFAISIQSRAPQRGFSAAGEVAHGEQRQ
jgi:hypothetical protein